MPVDHSRIRQRLLDDAKQDPALESQYKRDAKGFLIKNYGLTVAEADTHIIIYPHPEHGFGA
jgi:hypothetical protein